MSNKDVEEEMKGKISKKMRLEDCLWLVLRFYHELERSKYLTVAT